MTWVHRAATQPPTHQCHPPTREIVGGLTNQPDGQHGDLWRCDHCGLLWQIENSFRTAGPEWRPAGWWARWRNRHKGQETDHG